MNLPAAILCGGMGTRLYPLTAEKPKALVEILGEPFIAHQLRLLKASGIERVVLCVGHYGEALREYVGGGAKFGMTVEYSFDGPVLLGTAGALRQALPLLDDDFFVLYGDSYLPCDYSTVARCYYAAGKSALMTVHRNGGQWDASNVELSDGIIRVYDKKNSTPAMRHIDYGLGVFNASVFRCGPPSTSWDLSQLYQQLLANGELSACEIAERFYEIGSFEGIGELSQFLSMKRE